METRKLGSLTISLVGIGCNQFGGAVDEAGTRAVVDAAIDAGVNLFDTADSYTATRSEQLLGRVLTGRRDEVVVATKFGTGAIDTLPKGGSPAAVDAAVEGSLRRLGTDRIDLMQLHRPDPATPIGDTLEALDRHVRAGRVLEIGCSNFTGAQLDEAEAAARERGTARFVSVQNHLNLLTRGGEADLLAACERHDLAILPFFPLETGLLTGKYRRGQAPQGESRIGRYPEERQAQLMTERNFDLVEALDAFATARGHTLLELAMSWLACLPHMGSVIAGATRPDQVVANAGAVGWRLTPEELAEVDRITLPTT